MSHGNTNQFSYGYMIDNVILLITGTLHERDTHDLLDRCHPLGMFDSIAALCVATNVAELYNTVMIDSPLAPYFEQCLSAQDLDEMNIEIIRNTLYKAYLEDFYGYCQSVGGPTADVMCELLAVGLLFAWVSALSLLARPMLLQRASENEMAKKN
jgi:V-type H+-transporting ATPase subunit d